MGAGGTDRARDDLTRAGADLGRRADIDRPAPPYMWYIILGSSADERARISASVQRSSTLAMALRASTMIRRTEQVLRSPQSSQGRNAVTEAHGIGAKGPSRARTIAPTRISWAGRASAYPPPLPFLE